MKYVKKTLNRNFDQDTLAVQKHFLFGYLLFIHAACLWTRICASVLFCFLWFAYMCFTAHHSYASTIRMRSLLVCILNFPRGLLRLARRL